MTPKAGTLPVSRLSSSFHSLHLDLLLHLLLTQYARTYLLRRTAPNKSPILLHNLPEKMTDPESPIGQQPTAAPDAEQHPVEPMATNDQPEQPDQQHQHQQLLAGQSVDDNGAGTSQQQPQAHTPPPFQPLFTLVTDTTSRATQHPRVHYIFSDDDPDILTEALAQYSQQNEQQARLQQQQQRHIPVKGPSPSGSSSNKPLPRTSSPAPPPLLTDRAIVLDLVPKSSTPSSGGGGGGGDDPVAATTSTTISSISSRYEVAWASSLSADWAVVSAKISAMPDDDAARSGAGSAQDEYDTGGSAQVPQQQRLMLHIEGVDATVGIPTTTTAAANQRTRKTSAATRRPSLGDRDLRLSSGSANSGDKGIQQQTAAREDYNVIVDEFGKRMVVLRKVLDAGMERQRKVATTTTVATTESGGGHHEVPNAPAADDDDDDTQQQQQDPPKRQPTDRSTQQLSSNDGGAGAMGD